MKKYIIIILLGLITQLGLYAQADKIITIRGKVQYPPQEFKMQILNGKSPIASFPLAADGSYSYSLQVKTPAKYTLDCGYQSVDFWADDENLEINFTGCDPNDPKAFPAYIHIYGGPQNEVLNMFHFDTYRMQQMMIPIRQEAEKAMASTNQEWKDFLYEMKNPAQTENIARTEYLIRYYGNRISILAVLPYYYGNQDLVNETLAQLKRECPNNAALLAYLQAKEDASNAVKVREALLAPGKNAPVFEYPDADGKMLGIADFKGKILLIDFWASWCSPCRKEIPKLKEAYQKYAGEDVKFLSVSIDKDESAWRKALADENMPWPQVRTSDVGAKVSKDYYFSGIPHMVLIDKEGRIIVRGIHGADLDEAIGNALK